MRRMTVGVMGSSGGVGSGRGQQRMVDQVRMGMVHARVGGHGMARGDAVQRGRLLRGVHHGLGQRRGRVAVGRGGVNGGRVG